MGFFLGMHGKLAQPALFCNCLLGEFRGIAK